MIEAHTHKTNASSVGTYFEMCPSRLVAVAKLSGVKIAEPVQQRTEKVRKRGSANE